jgi:hypothetical protein
MIKTNGSDWLAAVLANNPAGERVELNPEHSKWIERLYVNNPLPFPEIRKSYNPVDHEHPLGFTWYLLGVNCDRFKQK